MTYERGDHITYRRRLAWADIETGVVISVASKVSWAVKPDESPGIRATIVYRDEIVEDKGE